MALIFPSGSSVGATYQSGSSPIYVYNGVAWDIQAANVVQNVTSASFALTAATSSYLETPTICLQGDLNLNVNDNTTLYADATVINISGLTNKFSIGGFTVSSTGITPAVSGFYEISYTGYGIDNGVSPTVGYLMAGVNNAEAVRTEISHPTVYRNGYVLRTIHQVTAGQLIDFRMSTSGGESIQMRNATIIIKRLG